MDKISSAQRSEIMRRIRGKDTLAELRTRKTLHRLGFRFRLHRTSLPGKPDIVLPKYKSVVFVHGCFWHGHTCKIGSGSRLPKTNVEYWQTKIDKNVKRDIEHNRQLAELGWTIMVIWECRTKTEDGLLHELEPLIKLRGRK
jgi:DNA mismatch endonuclease (patch repair protein)